MSYVILPDAQDEIHTAIGHYDVIDRRLGDRFNDLIEDLIHRIVASPLLWRERAGGYRRVNCDAFPYYVAYVIRGETIVFVAFAHAKRAPEYWKSRLG